MDYLIMQEIYGIYGPQLAEKAVRVCADVRELCATPNSRKLCGFVRIFPGP